MVLSKLYDLPVNKCAKYRKLSAQKFFQKVMGFKWVFNVHLPVFYMVLHCLCVRLRNEFLLSLPREVVWRFGRCVLLLFLCAASVFVYVPSSYAGGVFYNPYGYPRYGLPWEGPDYYFMERVMRGSSPPAQWHGVWGSLQLWNDVYYVVDGGNWPLGMVAWCFVESHVNGPDIKFCGASPAYENVQWERFEIKPMVVRLYDENSQRKDLCVSNPVSVYDGRKIQHESDYSAGDVEFSRLYQGGGKYLGSWAHSFNYGVSYDAEKAVAPRPFSTHVRPDDQNFYSVGDACAASQRVTGNAAEMRGGTCVKIADGQPVYFTVEGGSWPGLTTAVVKVNRPLRMGVHFKLSNGVYIPIGPNNAQLTKTDTGWRFKEAGLEEIYDLDGNITEIYEDGRLQKKFITTKKYTMKNLVVVQNGQGVELFKLQYDDSGTYLQSVNIKSNHKINYTYDGENRLIEAIKPNGFKRRYHYEDPRHPTALTGITDEKGVRYATWRYDEQGRAISSEHAGGAEKTTLSFNADGSTTVTNPLGKKTHYLFENVSGVKRVTKVTGEPTANCVGANQLYTYTANGLVDTQTDWNGNVTKFNYDNQNREISRTEAFGTAQASTTQTCWHATLNKPVRIIEPKQVELYEYDSNGQVLKHTRKPRPQSNLDCGSTL